MKYYSSYYGFVGDNKQVFDGIKSYLYSIKTEIEDDKKKIDKLIKEKEHWNNIVITSLKDNIDDLICANKQHDAIQLKVNNLSEKINSNETKFLADLIYLFCE